MSASLPPLSVEEFLDWEAGQEERYEFDGVQPVAMTGASFAHAMIVTRLIGALLASLRPGCVPVANVLKVVTERRVRYPDLTIVCGRIAPGADRVSPTYVVLEQDRPQATVRRRVTGWAEEQLEGSGAVLARPKVDVEVPLAELHAG
jgi:hypothetical protein